MRVHIQNMLAIGLKFKLHKKGRKIKQYIKYNQINLI